MDEKTEELRDIFIDVTDEETVTERQEEERGSLTVDEDDADAAIRDEIAEMRETYEFATNLDDADLRRVVSGFYEGESDAEIADDLDVSRRTVFRARADLHLVRDTDAPFDLATLRDLLDEELTVAEIADELDVAESTVRRYRRVVRARDEARRVSNRYRAAFEDALADVELAERMTEDVAEDGLDDATEGMETGVSF